jgi:hypothetical protein
MIDELKILFWNTYKQPLYDEIGMLVKQHGINLLTILENTGDESVHLSNLGSAFKVFNTILFKKVKIISSLDIKIKEVHGHGRYGIFHISGESIEDLLLVIVHFPSKVNWGDSGDHLGLCVELKRDIELQEAAVGHTRTIILGDFNMNPFEIGLINATGLNNTCSKEIAKTVSRSVYDKDYHYFYNPMWNFFGDFSKGNISGTHYFNTYKYINLHWNIYDQVMLRPSLLEKFDESKLDILTSVGNKSLTKKIKDITRVDKKVSDHLPLKFALTLNE